MKGRNTRRRGSVLDLLLILLIVLSVTGLLWRRYVSERNDAADNLSLYTVYAQSTAMDAMTFDCMQAGERLYTASGELFGEIAALERAEAEVTLISDGIFYNGAWEEQVRCTARVKICVSGKRTDRGVIVSGRRLAVGGTLPTLYSPRAALHLQIYKLEAAES